MNIQKCPFPSTCNCEDTFKKGQREPALSKVPERKVNAKKDAFTVSMETKRDTRNAHGCTCMDWASYCPRSVDVQCEQQAAFVQRLGSMATLAGHHGVDRSRGIVAVVGCNLCCLHKGRGK